VGELGLEGVERVGGVGTAFGGVLVCVLMCLRRSNSTSVRFAHTPHYVVDVIAVRGG
jgi:hypothetical protein